MRNADVVVLSRFPEIFEGFRRSVDADCPDCTRIVVWDKASDQHLRRQTAPLSPWRHLVADYEFHIARNANCGWAAADPLHDLIYAGDDTRIVQADTILRLRQIAAIFSSFGIIAARTDEDCNRSVILAEDKLVPFVFVFIRREVIWQIGYLDESFTGYGVEDIDYCYRARKAGWKVGYANNVVVRHGVDGQPFQSTFRRVKTQKEIDAEDAANWIRFCKKHGIGNPGRDSGVKAVMAL